MADMLSRSEVESLLSALDSGSSERKPTGPTAAGSFSSLVSDGSRSGAELARKAVQFFESFRLGFQETLSGMLGESLRLKRHMPMRVTLAELTEKRNELDHLFVLEAEQAGGDLILLVERSLSSLLVERLLGGNAASELPEFNPESHSLDSRIVRRAVRDAAKSARNDGLWQFRETDAFASLKECQSALGEGTWWCETWELKGEGVRGTLRIAASWEFLTRTGSQSE